MLWGKGWSFTPCRGRARAAQRWSRSGRLLPWQSSEIRNQQATPLISQANQQGVTDFPLYLQRIYVHGQNHAEVEQVLLRLSKHQLYINIYNFFFWGVRLLCIELSSLESLSLLFFLDCLAVLAITQLYQHILEAWRTCREAWGCLFGDRNIMTFWLQMVRLSWSVNTARQRSYRMNLYYIWSEV